MKHEKGSEYTLAKGTTIESYVDANGNFAERSTNYGESNIKKQMAQNSAAWKDADEAGKTSLHNANLALASQLSNPLGYDAESGTYGTGGRYVPNNELTYANSQSQYIGNSNGVSNPYSDMLRSSLRGGNAYLQAQYRNNLNQIDRKVKDVYGNRDKALTTAYGNYLNTEKKLPQILAAQGYTGGLAETTYGNLFNGYQDTYGNIVDTTEDTIQGLYDQRGNSGVALQGALANANSQYQQQLASMLNSQIQSQGELAQAQYKAQQQQADNKYNQMSNLLKMGIYNTGMGELLGVSEEAAQAYAKQVQEEQQAKIDAANRSNIYRGSTSGSSSGGITYSSALSALSKGIVTPQIASALNMTIEQANAYVKSMGGQPYGEDGAEENTEQEDFMQFYGLVNGLI